MAGLGQFEPARALLREAHALVAKDRQVLQNLGRLAEQTQRWEEAASWWRLVIAEEPQVEWPRMSLVRVLRNAGRKAEAAAALAEFAARFPQSVNARAENARAAEVDGKSAVAAARWQAMRDDFPGSSEGHLGLAKLLTQQGGLAEARAVLVEGLGRFPQDTHLLHDLARLEEAGRHWAAAIPIWRRLATDDAPWWLHEALAQALARSGDQAAGDAVYDRAATLFPAEPQLLLKYTFSLGKAGLAQPALARVIPALDSGAMLAPGTLAWFGEVALLASDGATAARCLDRIGGHAEGAAARLRLEGLIGRYQAERAEDERRRSRSALAMRFESLGGGSDRQDGWGFGCEFGFFQRWCGAEPMGLLRWASVTPTNLAAGLRARFADIEDLAYIRMRYPREKGGAWGVSQTRYGLQMDHLLTHSSEPEDAAARRISRALDFLRRKLIEELEDGSKLFVHRVIGREMTETEVADLAGAVNAYGHNTLLIVGLSTPDHPAFTAVRRHAGLVMGYIDRFAPDGDSLDSNNAGWEKLCLAVLALT